MHFILKEIVSFHSGRKKKRSVKLDGVKILSTSIWSPSSVQSGTNLFAHFFFRSQTALCFVIFCSTLGIFNFSRVFSRTKKSGKPYSARYHKFCSILSSKKNRPNERGGKNWWWCFVSGAITQSRSLIKWITNFLWSNSVSSIDEGVDALGRTITNIQLGTTSSKRLHDKRSGTKNQIIIVRHENK